MSEDPKSAAPAPAPAPTLTPPPPASTPARAPRRPTLLRTVLGLAGYLLSVVAVLGALLAALGWLLATQAGTAWLLERLPVAQISGVRGALFGDFEADSVTIPLSGEGAQLRVQQLRWRNPQWHPVGLRQWFRISLDELSASRVDLKLSSEPSVDIPPPKSLALPIGLDLTAVRIDELHIGGLDAPWRDIGARLSLGAADGDEHRLEDLHLRWDQLQVTGQARVATHGELAVDATLELTQQFADQGEWQAKAQLSGPLAAPLLKASVRAQATAQRPAQALDASVALKPFAAWPLGELQASARGFNLSALQRDAPLTALDLDATASTQGMDQPAALSLRLTNRAAGAWNEARLPLRSLQIEARARPDDPSQIELSTFTAELGTMRASAGRISGSGRWTPAMWQTQLRLAALQPALLDARAPAMQLDGPLRVEGTGFDAGTSDAIKILLRGQLDGRLLERGPPQPVQLRIDASLGALRVEVHDFLAQAGAARASLSGQLSRASRRAAWAVRAQASLQDFDPQPWWPGRLDSPWRQGPHRVNGNATVDLTLPGAPGTGSALQLLSQLHGSAQLRLEPSQLAGVPVSGSLAWSSSSQELGQLQLQFDAADNKLNADVRLGGPADGANDRWDLRADMPALNRLQALSRLLLDDGDDTRLAGALQAKAQLNGRWPALQSQGTLDATGLQFGEARAAKASGRWTIGATRDAPLDVALDLRELAVGKPTAESVMLQLAGTMAAHTLDLRADAKALPPVWVERIRGAPGGAAAKRTLARLQVQGSLLGSPAQGVTGWRGKVGKLELRGDVTDAPAWVSAEPFDVDLQWRDSPLRAKLSAGRADVLGATLRWSRVAWSAADPGRAPALLDAEATLEPLDVAPLLARLQPRFGWGGDLRVNGHLKVRSAPDFSADIVVERSAGDLKVTDDSGTRWLGLSDLRIGLNTNAGVWSFTTGLAGKTLGQAAGAVVARTSPRATWPAADAPIDGVLELQIADIGVWGPWLPPGWRLSGAMHANATFGGRFGAPEYVGALTGKNLLVRNLLQGVEVRDGEVDIKLLGDNARIERFTANAGNGSMSLQGSANLGESPQAELKLLVEKFQLLGRVDRRIVTSGEAVLKLGRDSLALDGDFLVDEGLIDFTRSEAPTLSADVHVHRGGGEPPDTTAVLASDAEAAAKGRKAALDLRVRLGSNLRVRGQGLDTGLRGDLRLTAPAGRLRVDGSVRTADGTYRAYRQRLNIERGVLTFNGPVENPQLDIEAVRPNLDVRVGVAVTGTVLVPRVRLFSEPEMSDADKLSWLLRGRASEGQGTADTAMLQAAAMALLAGDEPSALEQLFNTIGLDDLSVRQNDSAGGGAIVSVGKQLSRNWYVGYERGLNATAGNWQLIYRIAQRFTVRAQSGESNSLELIWSWRWQ